MARSVLVDAGFLVALLSRRDANHRWAAAQAPRMPPPWRTCEAALSEAFHLLERFPISLTRSIHRHARPCAGHPRLLCRKTDVDGRDKSGHDGENGSTSSGNALGARGVSAMAALLRSRAVICVFRLDEDVEEVLKSMQKYADMPMSLAAACLVRMTEALPDPVLLTTDTDFRVYRRHGRQAVPCVMPG